jgi:DNA-binding response OmpR family regulator
MAPAKRILVVDDDPNVRELLQQRLQSNGYETMGASSGQEALRRIDSASFDVIVLDLLMPDGGGIEVLRALDDRVPRPQCIVMSALADLWRRSSGAAEQVDVLQKPFPFQQLLALIAK